MRYLANPAAWDVWLEEHQRALLGKREPISLRNEGLGRSVHDGNIVGRIDAYPTGQELIQESWLAHVLDPLSNAKPSPPC